MHFLYPWMLLGTLGIAVPIVIHLLNRYRFRVVEWGAMELLRRALIVRARRIRLEDVLLLLMRCLIILLVALALARPVLTPTGGASGGGSAAGVVLALDASFSMAQRPGVNSRFERAQERAREVARTLQPGSPLTLVLLGDRPRVLLRNVGYDADRFETVLKETAPLPERLTLESGLEEIHTLLDELAAPAKECYFITDAQADTWGTLSEKSRQALLQLANKGKAFYLPVVVDDSENLALTRFELKSGLLRRGSAARYDIEVANLGNRRRESVPVSLLVNEVVLDQRVLEVIEPGQTATISLFARFDKLGVNRLTARLGTDELLVDNDRHAIADIRDKLKILYVRAPSAEGKEDRDFILTALAPRPTEALTVEAIPWVELPAKRLGDYRTVILSNLPDLPDEQWRNLFFFVKGGGGLLVFLGDNVQPVIYNARLRHDNVPLLPAELVEAQQTDSSGLPIEPLGHPLARVLRAVPGEMVREARVYRYFRLKLSEGGQPAVRLAGRDEPLIAEKQLGRGRVVLFGSAADRAWNNLLVEPAFYPLLIQESLTFLSRQPHERAFAVSDALSIPLPLREDATIEQVTFQQPGGQAIKMATVRRENQVCAELNPVEKTGFFEIRAEEGSAPLQVAVNVDPRESRLQPLSSEALMDTTQGLRLHLIPDTARVEVAVRESRIGHELRKQLLIAGLLLLVVEGFLALWFSKKQGGGK